MVDEDYRLHVEASAYLAGLRAAGRAFNTEKTYAGRIALYLSYCQGHGVDWSSPGLAQLMAMMRWLVEEPMPPRSRASPNASRIGFGWMPPSRQASPSPWRTWPSPHLGRPGQRRPHGQRPSAAARPAREGERAMSHEPANAGRADDGEDALGADIAQFVTFTRSGPWVLAYLVARRVTPGEGACNRREDRQSRFDRNGFRRISAREFARRTGTTAKRVMALWEAWNRLAADGVVPPAADLHPGVDVELPSEDQYPFYGKTGYYRS